MREKILTKTLKDKKFLLIILGLIIPLIFVFKSFFSSSSLSLGDAPYFSKSSAEWYLSEPPAWTQRGNPLGGINQFLWIAPLMTLISVAQHFLSLSHWTIIRIFFYFPSVVLGMSGAYFFSTSRKYSSLVSFFSALLFIFNTYFLLIVDGGQVGIALADGIFPWALLLILNYLEKKPNSINFATAVGILTLLTIADPRVAIISLITVSLFSLKNIKKLIILSFWWLAINLYWIYPLINLPPSVSIGGDTLKLTSFLNGIFLYSPHWYENLYGKVTYPSILFIPLVLFLLVGVFKPKGESLKIILISLFLIFLVKGDTQPLGNIYAFFVKLPFGVAFRDSTKFFIPLTLIFGILVGTGIEIVTKFLKAKYFVVAAYFLLLLPFYPVVLNKMNFVLSGREALANIENVNKYILENKSEDRTVWIPERDPRSIDNPTHEAIDGRTLTDFRPFASLNVGNGDLFNFFNDPQAKFWLPLLGIKNIVLSGNPRIRELNKSDREDWSRLNTLIPSLKYLYKENTDTDTPVYSVNDSLPRIFGLNKLFVVVGGDDIYDLLSKKYSDFKPSNNGFIFTDDGKWDPSIISEYSTSSAVIVKNATTNEDLTMSLLQKYFMSGIEAKTSQWAKYNSSDYLTYKYELLIRKFTFKDFDFNKGISFSTNAGEKMNFEFNTLMDGDFVVAMRSAGKGTEGLNISIDSLQVFDPNKVQDHMYWTTHEVSLKKGKNTLTIENKGDLQIVNIVAVIPKGEYLAAQAKAKDMLESFPSFDVATLPKTLLDNKWQTISYTKEGVNRYVLEPAENVHWVVWSNSYSPLWRLARDRVYYNSLPFYSAINGIYKRPEWSVMTLEFAGQENVRWGIYLSILSLIIFTTYILWTLPKK